MTGAAKAGEFCPASSPPKVAVELSAAIVRSPSGQSRGIMAIGRDVTERCAREQAQHERIASLERQLAAGGRSD